MKQTFQKISKNMIELPAKELFFFAKLAKLNGLVYKKEILARNKETKEKELNEETISKYTADLQKRGYINIKKVILAEGQFPTNKYEVNPIKGRWISVYNSFIELPSVSPEAKGFAIKLAMLDEIPESYNAISKKTNTSNKTAKKYVDELKEKNILIGNKLSSVYFPEFGYYEAKDRFETELKNVLAIIGQKEETKETKRYKKQLLAVTNYMKDIEDGAKAYNYGYNMLIRIQTNTFKKDCVAKKGTDEIIL